MDTSNQHNNGGSNNGGNTGNNSQSSGGGGGGWFSSLNMITDQINQFKDVMNTNTKYGDDYDDEDNGIVEDEDDLVMMRAEVNKYKDLVAELEGRLHQSDLRTVTLSKEYGAIVQEKQKEMEDLKLVIENLKSSLMNNNNKDTQSNEQSPKTDIGNNTQQQQQENNKSSLGITMENEDSNLVYDDHHNKVDESDIKSLQLELKNVSENYQNQISTLQSLNQDKLFKLNFQIETLQQENEVLLEKEKQDSVLIDGLKNDNQTLKSQQQEFNKLLETYGSIEDINNKLNQQQEQSPTKENVNNENQESNNSNSNNTASTTELNEQIEQLKEQLAKSTKELARLRQHLLETEESHTITEMEMEEQITKLKIDLEQSSKQNKDSSDLNHIVEDLTRELKEKDNEIDRHIQIVNNLNSVLEQFQAAQQASIQTELIGINHKLKESQQEVERLNREMVEYEQLKLSHTRLQDTIDQLYIEMATKTKEYQTLKEDIEPLKVAFDKNILRLSDMCLQEQESVDKRIVSKLFLTYFAKGSKKQDVLALISKMLNFNDEEKAIVGLTRKQWSIPFFGSATSTPGGTTLENGEKPLTDMWIEFLLKEANVNNSGENGESEPSGYSTPVSTPTKKSSVGSTPSLLAPPPSPSTPFKPTPTPAPAAVPINNDYFSITPNPNGKLKSTIIYDGDVSKNLYQ